MARMLLTSVFKPFAIDDIYSRKESICELFHNQLTHYQDIYSPRKHYPTYGLHLIANNISMPSTVIDYPTLPGFIREIIRNRYDYIGIGAIVPNFQKVKKMSEVIRDYSPQSKIIIGGFCATVPQLEHILDVDYVCIGEGISFVRELIGDEPDYEFSHPDVGDVTVQMLGIPLRSYLPSIVTSLGCTRGCDFCSPSHFFGKKHITLLKTGRDIFNEMQRLEKKYNTTAFGLVGDDNFLLNRKRAKELHDLIVESGKPYSYGTFGSADLIRHWSCRELAEMGVDSIWIGRESKFDDYGKNEGIDLKGMIKDLKKWGIRTILSSILLLDRHTGENIQEDIDDHLACAPTFSQFSFYSPAPGTPLWDRMEDEGRLLKEIPYEDCHAFKQPWFYHPHFTLAEAEKVQRDAYLRDYHELGPSLARLLDTVLEGYLSFRDTDSPSLLARAREIERRKSYYKSGIYAMELLAPTREMRYLIRDIRRRWEDVFGKLNPFEMFLASGGYTAGTLRRVYNHFFTDVLQPRTMVTHYPGRS